MRFLVTALFALSTQALAATPVDKLRGTIGSVSMDADRVDVPLYSAPSGHPQPSVQVTIGEHQYLFKLDTAATGVYASPRVVKNHKLKEREGNKKLLNLKGEGGKYKLGGEHKYADVGEIRIGNMILNDVSVATTRSAPWADLKDLQAPAKAGLLYDGVIGLGALPTDVSWAILPSTGQVSFARGASVAGLVEGGVTVPYSENESYVYKYGLQKGIVSSWTLNVDVNIGGQVLPTLLSTGFVGGVGGVYYSEEPSPAEVNGRVGDIHTRHHTISVGDTQLGTTWMAEVTALPEMPLSSLAIVGTKLLHRYDIAANRDASTVTLRLVDNAQWADPREFLLAEALKAVAPDEETVEDSDTNEESAASEASTAEASTESKKSEGDVDLLATGEKKDDPDSGSDSEEDASTPPGSVQQWATLKDVYVSMGDMEKSIEAVHSILAFDERDCLNRISLGDLQLQSGDVEAAKASFQSASDAYHAWFDRPLETRKELKEDFGKLDKDEKETSEFYPVKPGCYTADGRLAGAAFASGDLGSVQTLYKERFDLDRNLALVAANSFLSEGDYARAQASLRQVLKSPGVHGWARLGLAMSYAGTGDWEQASLLFDRSLETHTTSQSVKVWLDAYTAAQGHDAARAAVTELVKNHPEATAPHFGLAYILRDSDDEEERARVQAAGEARFQAALVLGPRKGAVWAGYARWLNLWGEVDQAESAALKALAVHPGHATAYLALAEIYASREDLAKSSQYTMKAAKAQPYHPGYAVLINDVSQ